MVKRAKIIVDSAAPPRGLAFATSNTFNGPLTNSRAVDLFLDSGVFSAWNRGLTLDLKTYIKYVKRHESILNCYATMDVIPGKFGEKRTKEQVEASAAGSFKNTAIMKDAGLKPIPIFHQGESMHWLEKIIKAGDQYVGISTAKDLRVSEQRSWLDEVFAMITDSKGVPFIRTHGFGITNIALLMRYPWFTSDSTTWSLAAGFGLIYVPGWNWRDNKPDYSQIPVRIIMSGRQQKAKSSAQRQYEALSKFELMVVDKYLEYLGLTVEQVRYDSAARRHACLRYFMDFGESHKHATFKPTHKRSLWDAKSHTLQKHGSMNVIFATLMFNGLFSQIMNGVGSRNRLVSYWESRERDDEFLRTYVTHGIHDANYLRRPAKQIWNDTYMTSRRFKLIQRVKDQKNAEHDGTYSID